MHFARRVAETIAKYRMLEAADRILVAVSGGADSVSLLLALRELGYSLGIGHLNHGLRGADADGDAQFVADLASRLDLPFFSRKVDIRAKAGNIEELGRDARREFLKSISADHGFSKIAVAHTREDRVETCLLHLFRGAGIEGMVSMAPVSGTVVRPLIEASRESVEAFLNAINQPWRTDATNMDSTFARNRLRWDIMPELGRAFNPNLTETLSRTVELLQNEDAWMQELTSIWVAEHVHQTKGESSTDAHTLNRAPVALARRAIRSMARQTGSALFDVTFVHIENVRGLLADGKSGKTIQLPGGLVAERDFDRLVIRRTQLPVGAFCYELPIPGTVHIPEIGTVFRAGIADAFVGSSRSVSGNWVFVDGGRLGPCVKIRNWQPGDYYKPTGWPSGKLKKLFQRAQIPRSQRSRWPVFENESTIVWVASFPVSREFAPSKRSQKVVAIEIIEATEAVEVMKG